jgi:hypothetical protein
MPKEIRVYKGIQREVKIRGLSPTEYVLLGVTLLGGGTLLLVISMIISVGVIPYIGLLGLVYILLQILKYSNKKDHPTFLESFLVYKINQPKKVDVQKQPKKFSIKELKESKYAIQE